MESLRQDHDRLFGSSRPHLPNLRLLGKDSDKNDRDTDNKDGNEVAEPVLDFDEDDDVPTNAPTGEATQEEATQLLGETRIDLVKLIPFDVKISLFGEDMAAPFNTFVLTDIVSEWMEESLAAQVLKMELGLTHSEFDSVILEERSVSQQPIQISTQTSALLHHDGHGRQLQFSEEARMNTIASYEGVTLWKHSTNSDQGIMTPLLLEDIQRQALLQDDLLLAKLRLSPAEGLGVNVQDVRAYINPNPQNYVPISPVVDNSQANANLELIIVVAIVIACMAFAFLVFALFWAWRFDQQRRDQAYRVENPPKKDKSKEASSDVVATDTSEDPRSRASQKQDDESSLPYPSSEINPTSGHGGLYPESVVSEDISTSLSAYYRSGMGTRPLYNGRGGLGANDIDNVSMSSMESYGYSLDGYAPSLCGNTYAKPDRPPSELGDQNSDRPQPESP